MMSVCVLVWSLDLGRMVMLKEESFLRNSPYWILLWMRGGGVLMGFVLVIQ